MLCPRCGTQSEEGAQTCPSCGSPLNEYVNMPPKKKSKAPIIIALSSILLVAVIVTVICVLVFCGKKGGQSTAKEAVNATLKASSKYDFDETLDTLHPVMKEFLTTLKKEDKSQYESMKESMSDDLFPIDSTYSISDFEIEEEEAIASDEIKELNDSLSILMLGFSSEYDFEFDIDDYKMEKAVGYSGSYTATSNGDTDTIYFEMIVVKCDDRWYTFSVEIY